MISNMCLLKCAPPVHGSSHHSSSAPIRNKNALCIVSKYSGRRGNGKGNEFPRHGPRFPSRFPARRNAFQCILYKTEGITVQSVGNAREFFFEIANFSKCLRAARLANPLCKQRANRTRNATWNDFDNFQIWLNYFFFCPKPTRVKSLLARTSEDFWEIFTKNFRRFFFVNGTSQDENGSGTKPMSNEFKVESTTICGKLKSNPEENYTGNLRKTGTGNNENSGNSQGGRIQTAENM